MKYTFWSLAILVGGCLGWADASGCRVVRSQVVVEQIAVATFVPLAITVPAYSVGGYGGGTDLTPLLEELRAMRQELQQFRLGHGKATGAEPAFVSLVRQNCAACHGATPKGNKLAFFGPEGTWKEPTPELLGDIIAQISSGRMPPKNAASKMTADDRLALIAGLTSTPQTAEAVKMPKKDQQP